MKLFKQKPTWSYFRHPRVAARGHVYSSITILLEHPSGPGVRVPIELTQSQREWVEQWFDVGQETK